MNKPRKGCLKKAKLHWKETFQIQSETFHIILARILRDGWQNKNN